MTHPIGTKLKWISDDDSETYRVAIVTKDGILQVKSVTEGVSDCHDHDCTCSPCWEYTHQAPWRPHRPLRKSTFANELSWSARFPGPGTLKVTLRRLSDKALKKLCCDPLTAKTDLGRLMELEYRFPRAAFVLTTATRQIEVSAADRILCRTSEEQGDAFADFGARPSLMVEWRGMYIDLSHLF